MQVFLLILFMMLIIVGMTADWPEGLDQVEVRELVQLHKGLQGLEVELLPVGRTEAGGHMKPEEVIHVPCCDMPSHLPFPSPFICVLSLVFSLHLSLFPTLSWRLPVWLLLPYQPNFYFLFSLHPFCPKSSISSSSLLPFLPACSTHFNTPWPSYLPSLSSSSITVTPIIPSPPLPHLSPRNSPMAVLLSPSSL